MSKLCTIIGMGPGVSLSIARRFAKEGFTVAMVARNEDKLKQFQVQLNEEGLEGHGFIGDAANFDSLRSAFGQIHKQLGETHVLVYNVSVFREATPTELDAEICVEDFRANVGGAIVAVQQVVDDMKAQGEGVIFLTGGGQGLEPYPSFSSLAIGKSAMRSLAFSLHGDLKNSGICVSTVTINGVVDPTTKFAPNLICEAFWKLYESRENEMPREVIYE